MGRTNQRLGDRIKQHVPSMIRNGAQPSRQQPGRLCRSGQLISCDSAVGKHFIFSTELLLPKIKKIAFFKFIIFSDLP